MLSAKQGSIKYHFLSLWYDSTWDWTQVSRAIGDITCIIKIILSFFGYTTRKVVGALRDHWLWYLDVWPTTKERKKKERKKKKESKKHKKNYGETKKIFRKFEKKTEARKKNP